MLDIVVQKTVITLTELHKLSQSSTRIEYSIPTILRIYMFLYRVISAMQYTQEEKSMLENVNKIGIEL